jgi:dTDP-4-amino-4,6-dideoxygalactose transaminase
MLVHMAGLISPDFDVLSRMCKEHNLALIEDAAHAHGASIYGHKAGSLGKIGCFSFYPTKIITTGEGGMLTTNDDNIAEVARSYRNHGLNSSGEEYVRVSANWRLPESSIAIGLTQLEHLDEFVDRRNQIARYYDSLLSSIRGIKILPRYPHIRHSYWNYITLLTEGIDRQRLAQQLAKEYGVQVAWPYDPLCHLQPVFRERLGCGPGDLPISEQTLSRHLALPIHVGLSDDDVEYVVRSLVAAISNNR